MFLKNYWINGRLSGWGTGAVVDSSETDDAAFTDIMELL